ncbi:hypothetical protein ACFY2R_05145 [Micromonospora olivasterospora]|uniref:DUF5666 domain-containing protein n=1 Tax=Micromonospora olivasterospora TaxID=1880 RepID=A0A562I9B7_MICOL|nr:hypothetical protein [Micromonospora olivasterospora]TWH67325.1 hypothetical protein JD77_02300 [Micromonospora olivasterospora]
MARHGLVAGTSALLAALAFGVAGCGPAEVTEAGRQEAAVEVSAALGEDGQALAALGFDPGDLDLERVAAPAPAASGEPSPSAGEKARRGERAEEWRKRHRARVLLRRGTLHGEAVVRTKDGGTRTVAVQRGEVTAIDGDSMTVKSTDGFTMTWAFGENLRVVERRTTIQPSAVKVGTTVGVAGAKNGDTATARLVLIR